MLGTRPLDRTAACSKRAPGRSHFNQNGATPRGQACDPAAAAHEVAPTAACFQSRPWSSYKPGTAVLEAVLQNTEQRLDALKRNPAPHHFCLTGGPGTGKTVVDHLAAESLERGWNVLLLCPTRKLACRLVNKDGVTSITLQRLLAMENVTSVANFASQHVVWIFCETGMVTRCPPVGGLPHARGNDFLIVKGKSCPPLDDLGLRMRTGCPCAENEAQGSIQRSGRSNDRTSVPDVP